MSAAIDHSAIETLRTGLRGAAHAPGDEGYDEGRRAFNLNAHQEPALVVVAESAADVVAAVRLAGEKVEVAGVDSDSPLTTLELRELGGALARTTSDLSPIGHRDSKFIMNGIGMTPTPEAAKKVQSYLAYVAESTRSYQTGATYVDFLELDGATPERVRAAYSQEDWERLITLKDRYDPGNTFRFNRNIPPS